MIKCFLAEDALHKAQLYLDKEGIGGLKDEDRIRVLTAMVKYGFEYERIQRNWMGHGVGHAATHVAKTLPTACAKMFPKLTGDLVKTLDVTLLDYADMVEDEEEVSILRDGNQYFLVIADKPENMVCRADNEAHIRQYCTQEDLTIWTGKESDGN